jgi:hypothetical protein
MVSQNDVTSLKSTLSGVRSVRKRTWICTYGLNLVSLTSVHDVCGMELNQSFRDLDDDNQENWPLPTSRIIARLE